MQNFPLLRSSLLLQVPNRPRKVNLSGKKPSWCIIMNISDPFSGYWFSTNPVIKALQATTLSSDASLDANKASLRTLTTLCARARALIRHRFQFWKQLDCENGFSTPFITRNNSWPWNQIPTLLLLPAVWDWRKLNKKIVLFLIACWNFNTSLTIYNLSIKLNKSFNYWKITNKSKSKLW
jgi:hypothetical protein